MYLDSTSDVRAARSTLIWVRDTLAVVARKNGRPNAARLIQINVSSSQPSAVAPSLDEFRNKTDPSGVYRENELVALYTETYPQLLDRRIRRNARLRERQIEAVNWLEKLATVPPNVQDPLSVWLPDNIASRIEKAGLATITDLYLLIQRRGARWWTTCPGVGIKSAERVVDWLGRNADLLGIHISSAMQLSARNIGVDVRKQLPKLTAVVAIEHFVIPALLNGTSGTNRANGGRDHSGASNDLEAIQVWLARCANDGTRREYRKQAERLLLWSVFEKSKAFSSLTANDCVEYRNFLAQPSPAHRWIGKRHTPRWSPDWRPFEGALSPKSISVALNVLNAMCVWLCDVRYLDRNPFKAMPQQQQSTERLEILDIPDSRAKAFTNPQWELLQIYLRHQPNDESGFRLRFIVTFAYWTGLRVHELADAGIGRLYTRPLSNGSGTQQGLIVKGKGSKVRIVPMPSIVWESMIEYFVSRDLTNDLLTLAPATRLIERLDLKDGTPQGLSASMIYHLLRRAFQAIAVRLETQGLHVDARAFKNATPHWLRHTFGTHRLHDGLHLNQIQRVLGHSSIATTGQYTNADDEALFIDIQTLAQASIAHASNSKSQPGGQSLT
jgi:site-specific recombinase XerD